MDKKIAVIIPVYNEEKAIQKNILEISKILSDDNISFSFTLVDDGSKDDTWLKITQLSHENKNLSIQGIRFSRNFGKEAAICAGIACTDSDLYLVMDSDLQHPPSYVKNMVREMETQNADIVECVKSSRGKESLKYKLIARTFYKILKKLSGLEMDNSSDFKLFNKKTAEAINTLGEGDVFFRGIVNWVGFKNVQIPFVVDSRADGSSRFSTAKLIKLALDAVLSYTAVPLLLTVFLGVVFFIAAIILGIQTLVNYFTGISAEGFSTVILIILITSSMIMFSLGIIGIYIARIYDAVKNRPRYIISDRIKTGKQMDGNN